MYIYIYIYICRPDGVCMCRWTLCGGVHSALKYLCMQCVLQR